MSAETWLESWGFTDAPPPQSKHQRETLQDHLTDFLLTELQHRLDSLQDALSREFKANKIRYDAVNKASAVLDFALIDADNLSARQFVEKYVREALRILDPARSPVAKAEVADQIALFKGYPDMGGL